MSLHVTFGIDPGLTGAVAVVINGQAGPVLDMLTMTVGTKTEVDPRAIVTFVKQVRQAHPAGGEHGSRRRPATSTARPGGRAQRSQRQRGPGT